MSDDLKVIQLSSLLLRQHIKAVVIKRLACHEVLAQQLETCLEITRNVSVNDTVKGKA